jgi:serine/threonine-protein kinase
VQADAEQLLKDSDLSVLVVQSVDASVAVGTVIRTEPAAGEVVAAGSTVVVYISRQQVTTTTTVPSLFGLSSVDDARTLLVQKHLTLGSQTEEYSDMPVGSIIAQSVDAGTTVKLNTRVSVTVSAGPEPTPEPTDEEFDWDDLTSWDTDRSEDDDDRPSDGFGQFWKWFTGGA